MKRIQYARYGGPKKLKLADYSLDPLENDQLRIRVKAASVNPVDWKIRDGVLKMMTGRKFPRGMGEDFAGVVEAVGPDVKRYKAGDEVFGAMPLKQAASFADLLQTPEDTVALMPRGLSFEEASALPTVAQTAWLALVEVAKIQPRQHVFVNGCLGSVGRCAVQIARLHQAEVAGTCSQSGSAEATALGVEEAVDYSRFNAEHFRGKFDIILDASGNLTTAQCSTMLRHTGVALHINASFSKMFRVIFAPRNKLVFLKTNSELLTRVGSLAAEGKLKLPVSKTVSLQDAIPAVIELEQKGTPKGKLVIVPA